MLTDNLLPFSSPKWWGGIECTVSRTGNIYKNQMLLSHHCDREDDIEKIASLGFEALRYPILWEVHQPDLSKGINWEKTEEKLNQIKSEGMLVIAGLVHHGSGPVFTSLEDGEFSQKLAGYARLVAEKFPWIEFYTPINEPLTTARFSGLYGHWYPHKKNSHAFLKMHLNQVKATILAMQEIRKINPHAKLVQTEDLSKTHSTPLLKYQADFENNRRWLTFDLLCGKVNSSHPLWNYLLFENITEDELAFFQNNVCCPDIMGLNYYVTSERWLDEKIDLYPTSSHGGNGRIKYADTEAVRKGQMQGVDVAISEAWERYKIPLAITEAHLNCTREEQMRWLFEIWKKSCSLKNEGINILAITAWSLLGAYDWDMLLTENNLHYEPGIFDISNNTLRLTGAGKLIKELAETGKYNHPLLQQRGWWHKGTQTDKVNEIFDKPDNPEKLMLIIGKNGTLGKAFDKICYTRSIPHVVVGRVECNIENEQEIQDAIDRYKPWAIVNATGYVKVDEAESDAEKCFLINAIAPGILARICYRMGIKLMTFSSDLVFGGEKNSPYVESDGVNPLNVYGKSKVEGEILVNAYNPNALIIRTSSFFGPWDSYNFISEMIEQTGKNEKFVAASDVSVSPTYVPDLVNASLDLLIDDESGIWHLCNKGSMTWSQLATSIMEREGLQKNLVIPRLASMMKYKAQRPAYSVLGSGRGILLPSLDNALDNFFAERRRGVA